MHMVRNCPFIKRKQQPDFERNNSSLVKGFCYTPLPYKPLLYSYLIDLTFYDQFTNLLKDRIELHDDSVFTLESSEEPAELQD